MSSLCGRPPTNRFTSSRIWLPSAATLAAWLPTCFGQPLQAVQLIVRVHRLADAVGEHRDEIARREPHRAVVDIDSRHRRPAARPIRRRRTASTSPCPAPQQRRHVAGVDDRRRLARGSRTASTSVTKRSSQPLRQKLWLIRLMAAAADVSLARQYRTSAESLAITQRRRNALARHVGQHDRQPIAAGQQNVVVKIAADLVGRS